MSHVTTDDGVKLYTEETGSGTPIVFVHEFAGDCRSWEPQVRHFSRRYRCITYNARGYPPSDVPKDVERYSQARARDDIRCVLDGLKIERAHIVGLSMGAFATLHFGMAYGKRALSLTIAGGAYGAHPAHYRVHIKMQTTCQNLLLFQCWLLSGSAQRGAAAILPPSTGSTVPVVRSERASITKARATSSGRTICSSRLPER